MEKVTVYEPGDKVYTISATGQGIEWEVSPDGSLVQVL